jgi:uncharacterized SAM-binding protein YcdF (DUF218 family)
VTNTRAAVTDTQRADAQTIWDYHQMHHQPKPCSAVIGLGSHDLGVATFAAELYRAGLFEVLVFSGANSPTTAKRFPRGEAVHATSLGVPPSAIIIEPNATNTGDNITFSRQALHKAGVETTSLLLISKPYTERRAYATCRKVWPQVEMVCASTRWPSTTTSNRSAMSTWSSTCSSATFNASSNIPSSTLPSPRMFPEPVAAAYARLVAAGFDSRLLKTRPSRAS